MKITSEFLREKKACGVGYKWVSENNLIGLEDTDFITKLVEYEKYDWANWLIVRVMTYKQCVSYAIFSAEQILVIYEKKYPEDKRPHKAIEAAKICIDDPSEENKKNVAYAAGSAAYAAGSAAYAAADVAYAAGSAAYAAGSAAYAAGSAAYAAGSAADAAYAADAAARAAGSAADAAYAADAAADAAYAAGSAAYAAGSAADAAYAAGSAARAARAAAKVNMQIKILKFGLELLNHTR